MPTPAARSSSSRSKSKSASVAKTPARASTKDESVLTLSSAKPSEGDAALLAQFGEGAAPGSPRRVKSVDPRVHEYIAPSDLANLAQYKYSGSDYSIVGPVIMQPYWRWVVEQIPLTVAPNALTLTGFFVSTSSTVLLLLYKWGTESGEIPAFAWVYAALSLFAYQTLDSIDGKQARRTGTQGPLGELFDHGCDAFFTPLVQMNTVMAIGQSDYKSFWMMALLCFGLLCAIWEQFVTGTLDLGYINGPTEGVLITCVMYLLTATYGPGMWTQNFAEPIVFPPPGTWLHAVVPSWCPGFTLSNGGDIMFGFMIVAAFFTVGANFAHVVTMPSVHPNLHPAKLWSFLLAPALLMIGFHSWVGLFPNMHHKYLMVPEFAFGMTTSFCATRMTIARLCKMRYRSSNKLTVINNIVVWSFIGLATLVKKEVVTQVSYAQVEEFSGYAAVGMALWGIVTYLHMATAIFRQLTEHLGVNLLTLTEKQHKAIAKKNL